jgi:hypothetical protein
MNSSSKWMERDCPPARSGIHRPADQLALQQKNSICVLVVASRWPFDRANSTPVRKLSQ